MPRTGTSIVDDPLWYKDAVIYELHIKAFRDSNGDGIGDIQGIIGRLDYLQSLGVTAIWLLPFYPSPLRDDGYDIASYTDIHPQYGSLGDFKELLRQAHKRGIRVITELVLNHTSDQHPWFQKSRRAKKGSSWRDYYVWSDDPEKYSDARIIFKDFEDSNWTWDPVAQSYYWHRFYSHQPDLNFDNPKVHKAIFKVLDFWFDMGIDGLRLDAVPYLYEREDTNCENLTETHDFLKKLRAHIDRKYKNRMLLAEANQWSEDAVEYFGDGNECNMAFNFPVMPRMFMALQMEDRYPIIEILDPPLDIPDNAQWAIFLRNHDELTLEMVTDEERDYMYRMYAQDPRAKINLGIRRRLAPLLGNNRRRIELMNVLLFSLPGTPVLYYGDEIGMGDNYYLGDRDGVRTPMQWAPDRNAGFSRANPQRLYLPVIIDSEYHYEALNVETQDNNASSLLWWMRRVIAMRKNFKAFGRGSCEFLSPSNRRVLTFIRRYEDEVILVVVNLSRFSQCVELDLSEYSDLVPREVFSQNDFPRIKQEPYVITVGPHDYFWFELHPAEDAVDISDEYVYPTLTAAELDADLMESSLRERIERQILPKYIRRARWFGSKGRRIRSIEFKEAAELPVDEGLMWLTLFEVTYNEGLPELYQLPLAAANGTAAGRIKEQSPQAVLADLMLDGERVGILFDASYDAALHDHLLKLIEKRRKLRGRRGQVVSSRGRAFASKIGSHDEALETRVLGGEQSNTSILYGNVGILKLYRKLEHGRNPDVEVGRTLSEKKKFEHTPAFLGSLEYRPKSNGDFFDLALFQEFVENQGDAWSFVTDHVWIYFENVLSRRREMKEPPELTPLTLQEIDSTQHPKIHPLVGEFHASMFSLLGERTGQMHLALAAGGNSAEWQPEPFSLLYQRSVYQTMRNLVRRVVDTLQKNINRVPKETRLAANEVLENEGALLTALKRMLQKKFPAHKIRIHGDYHLGQVLFTGKDFQIIDFEGEPARPISERRLKRSALRDVAGMVRSFHYAIYTGLLRHPAVRPEDHEFLIPWVQGWYRYAASLFLESYLETVDGAAFIPRKRDDANVLFEAFLLEKAVYELGYELNNRPDWVSIPLLGILDTLRSRD